MKDLNLLITFEAVISTGSVNAASKKLNITPSAVSQSLNRLRNKYEDPIFIRVGNKLQPTNFSKELYKKIKLPLTELIRNSEIKQEFNPETSNRTLKIATDSEVDLLLFTDFLEVINKKAPFLDVQITTKEDCELELQNDLRLRNLDLIITSIPLEERSFNNKIINKEELVVLANKNHPRLKNGMNFDLFFSEKHAFLNKAKDSNFKLDRVARTKLPSRKKGYTSNSMMDLIFIAAKTEFLTITSRSYYNIIKDFDIVKKYELPFDCNDLPIYLTWHKTYDNDEAIKWMVKELESIF